MDRLDDIQTALKPLKKRKKCENLFMTNLGLAESFKTMNRPSPIQRDQTRPDRNALREVIARKV